MQSWLALTKTVTPAGLPRAHMQAQNQSTNITSTKYKNEGPSVKMGFNGKTVSRFQTKKKEQKHYSRPLKNPMEHKELERVS